MKLTVYHDGQFFVGLIEVIAENNLKVYRHVFGKEPKDQEVLDFVKMDLQPLIEKHVQSGVSIQKEKEEPKKINPKRLQRKVSKELKQSGLSTKSQEALKAENEWRKKEKSVTNKQLREEQKQYKRDIKVQKAKAKHRGR
ncbi:YjdF family protein [Microbacteriaceae bacterium 4G12]